MRVSCGCKRGVWQTVGDVCRAWRARGWEAKCGKHPRCLPHLLGHSNMIVSAQRHPLQRETVLLLWARQVWQTSRMFAALLRPKPTSESVANMLS